MLKIFSYLVFLGFFFLIVEAYPQSHLSDNFIASAEESDWKGFERFDFNFQGKKARLILPKKPLQGNPWIWRARFPDWHTEADSILVSEGFHLAYINTDNLFGAPEAVKVWNDFHTFLTVEHKLQQKVSLMGVSRGGLFIYNWAKENPEKVACIYAEAPVLDFKSWPGGFGESEGSPKDWLKLKEVYNFADDEVAKAYKNNPVDNLMELPSHRVPILHMIGLEDQVVPVDENTLPFVQKYIKSGGIATVVTSVAGEQSLKGHHFPIQTPRLVADFIKYHSIQALPLSSEDYHQSNGGMKNSLIKFSQNESGRVAFLGGSITHNAGWRDSVSNYLQNRFQNTDLEFINAGIPSMGSTPSAFRLEKDVLAKGKIDLLFLEAAVNDSGNGRTSTEQKRAMEGIIRHAREVNPEMDIVIMHFVDPGKMASYNQGLVPEVIKNHQSVADHYNIPTINLAKEVTDRINAGEFTWEDDFKNLHPSPFGQGIYGNSIITFLKNSYNKRQNMSDKTTSYSTPERIDPYSYDKGKLIDINEAQLAKGWHIDSNWKPNDNKKTRPDFVNEPFLIGNKGAKSLKLRFEGNTVGIVVAAGQDAANISYRIDKGEWQQLDLLTKWSDQLHLPWYYTLASELVKAPHLLEIRVPESLNEDSQPKVCRIRYFYVN
ncbi:SGNH/GDSL hydrolase family protein [Cyclobacterium qasimii]|nr:SGNH/GDSL hydrolase family protein [Cyclobacterium qasimii]